MRISTPFAVFVGVLLGGLLLPYAMRRERAAKSAFEYVPPAGFTAATGEARRKLTQGTTLPPTGGADRFLPMAEAERHPDRKAWVGTPSNPGDPAPRIVLVHNEARGALDESALSRIASEMSEHQRSQGLDYSLAKKRIVERNDGARIGMVVWDVRSAPDSSQPATLPRRAVQLSFPDNEGISIVTAQFLATDDAVVSPLIESSIQDARGVAIRPGPLAWWIRLLAAVAGGALGYLIARLSARARGSQTA